MKQTHNSKMDSIIYQFWKAQLSIWLPTNSTKNVQDHAQIASATTKVADT